MVKDTAIDARRATRTLLFAALTALANPAAQAHYADAAPALWPQGAAAFARHYDDARRGQRPLLVYLHERRDGRHRAALNRPELRRVLSRFDAVRLDAGHGPAARRIAERLRRGGAAALYLLLPGSGLSPRRIDAPSAAAVAAATAELYRARARALAHAGRALPAARARSQARSFAKYLPPASTMN